MLTGVLHMVVVEKRRSPKATRLAHGNPADASQNDHSVDASKLNGQAFKLYLVFMLWPIYLFLLPGVWSVSHWLAIAVMVFPGAYLYCWLGVLMHECSHRYFPKVNNDACYDILSVMLFMDPQVFRLTHATHHTKVNTYEDLQIHPLGRISNRALRSFVNFLEIAFGDMFFMVASTIGVIRHPRLRRSYSIRKAIFWHLTWILSLTAVLFASSWTFGLTFAQVFLPTLIGMWLCALILRHNEMVQHANLIVDGTLEERNLKTRNMLPVGVAERVFLFLTHNDPRHHVLHHTLAKVYSRPFPDTIPMPDGAVYVTMKGYLRVLGQMLLGK